MAAPVPLAPSVWAVVAVAQGQVLSPVEQEGVITPRLRFAVRMGGVAEEDMIVW
jgi:hypothetical protein